ncbi:hypothetical protein BZM27_52185 [Paraburkholderia steynii]|uniref:Uncharacterized protein n=1 Tax=Paraburkholderia steynii TaxID=1245441 RepID=A0A4R0X2P1_9BURK|nr:hypothetical protein BZM27_52185 [Paraburkholderia steynii]
MASEGVPIRRVGTTPIEMCAKCGGPVDMSEFHLAYLEDESKIEGLFQARTVSLDYLAVICRQCRPLTLADSRSFVVDTDSDEAIEQLDEMVVTNPD